MSTRRRYRNSSKNICNKQGTRLKKFVIDRVNGDHTQVLVSDITERQAENSVSAEKSVLVER